MKLNSIITLFLITSVLSMNGAVSGDGLAESTSPSFCRNGVTGAIVRGYPKTHDNRRGDCISAHSRRPVEKIGQSGDLLFVKNFTHGYRLHYASIDLSKLHSGFLQLVHFAPVLGDHAQLRLVFSSPTAVRLFKTYEDLLEDHSSAELGEISLSIEGAPLVGEEYSFTGAIRHELVLVYRMLSISDKKHYAFTSNYPVRQHRLLYEPSFYRTLILEYVEKSKRVGFDSVYDLIRRNCGTETARILQDVSTRLPEPFRIRKSDVRLATVPGNLTQVFKKKGLLSNEAIPNLEDDSTVGAYDLDFYEKAEKEYQVRSELERLGIFLED